MEIIDSPFEDLLGIEILEKNEGSAVIRVSKKKELTNFLGIFHGGVLASIADTAAVQALMGFTTKGPYYSVTLNIKFKKPADCDFITAQAQARHLKSKFFETNITITDPHQVVLAIVTVKSMLPNYSS